MSCGWSAAACGGAPGAAAEHAVEAPASMLVPMGILTAACVIVGIMPGLLLVPIAALQSELGMLPITATWTGPLPSAGGWHPGMLSALLLVLVGIASLYLRLGRGGAAVIRSPIHMCGVGDLQPAVGNLGAANLYAAPDATIRRLLGAKHDTGYSDDDEADDANSDHTAV